MSHRHTVIEPADGLTVLIGPNNCGKSAFVTALQILCHNSKSGFVLRHGEKKCEVIVETTDGHVINWSRKKNGSGIYVVDGEPFDRLRGTVPVQVHEILKMPKVQCDKEEFDVHFGEQSEPVFLLRDRGKASAQFFASSSDATHLVAMQSLHKSKVLVHKRDFKQLTAQHDLLTGQLEALDPIVELDKKLVAAEKQHDALQSAVAKIDQSKTLIVAIQAAQSRFEHCSKQATPLQPLVNPPQVLDERPLRELVAGIKSVAVKGEVSQAMAAAFGKLTTAPAIKPTAQLESLLQQIKAKQVTVQQSNELAASFQSLSPAPAMTDVNTLLVLLQKLRERYRSSQVVGDLLAAVEQVPPMPEQTDIAAFSQTLDLIEAKQRQLLQKSKQYKLVTQELADLQDEFEQWVDANPVCPTCGGETDAQQVLQTHAHLDSQSSGDSCG